MTDSLAGQTLGPFRLSELLTSDEIIEVYSGLDSAHNQFVTVLIAGRGLQPDPVFNAQFRREVRALGELKHPNIAPVLDYGAVEDGHYISVEYTEGVPLFDLINAVRNSTRPRDLEDVTFTIRQLANALEYTHRAGIVHGAINPHNITMTRSGQAVLTHFGASLLYSRFPVAERGWAMLSPPEYLAPEQLQDPRAVMPTSDIYALGVLLYEMLTGERPFEMESDIDTALQLMSDTAPDPRLLNDALPGAVAEVTLKALSQSPAARFRSALRFANALEKALIPDRRSVRKALTQPGEEPTGADPNEIAARALPRPPKPPDVPPPGSQDRITARRSAAARIVVRREDRSPREQRRERRRLHQQANRIKRQQAHEDRNLSPEERALRADLDAARAALSDGAMPHRKPGRRIWLIILILLLALLGTGYGLVSLGMIPNPAARAEEWVIASTETITPAATQTPTATPTITPTPTATPLAPVEATPVPAVAFGEITAGTQAFRLADGATLVYVPAGSFLMGTSDPGRNTNAQPQHRVQLSSFWIDRTEVTNAQYEVCVEVGLCEPPSSTRYYEDPDYDNNPVTFVTYDDAATYCLWLALDSGQTIGLPTEAQWEKAAAWHPETGASTRYPWGNDAANIELLAYDQNIFDTTAPVGSYPAGASYYGVLDMAGNVWEWVADWYNATTYQRSGVVEDPTGPASGTVRITRGGSWTRPENLALSSSRNPTRPDSASNEIGFRCAFSGERPPANSGIYLSPLELITGLRGLIETPGMEESTREGWTSALDELEAALTMGDNNTALAVLTERDDALSAQSAEGRLSIERTQQLARSLEWLRAGIRPIEDGTG